MSFPRMPGRPRQDSQFVAGCGWSPLRQGGAVFRQIASVELVDCGATPPRRSHPALDVYVLESGSKP